MKKVLINNIELYKIEEHDLNHPYCFMAVSNDVTCYGWTMEDAVKQLLEKLYHIEEHRDWAMKNGWVPPKKK